MNKCKDGYMDDWTDDWTDEWMEREIQTGGSNSSQACRLRFRPRGSDPSLQTQAEALMLWSAYVSRRDPNRQCPLEILFICKGCTGFAQTKWLRFRPGGLDSRLEAEVHPWLELLPSSLPKTLRILVLLVLLVVSVFWRFYLFFIQGSIGFVQ